MRKHAPEGLQPVDETVTREDVSGLAAALAIPPLLLLYFLKLRRQKVPIASTLLWKRAVHDLQVNSPFQKLRNNLLLIMQLLILLAAIIALAEPIISARGRIEKSIVLLIDESASMGTKEKDGETRLDTAKREAENIIDKMTSDQQAMVIAFGSRARVLTPFTDDKTTLRNAVVQVKGTHASGRLHEAMQLAEAHSMPGEDTTVTEASQYILLTDGRLADATDVVVERGAHEALVAAKGVYADLWSVQSGLSDEAHAAQM